MSEVHCDNLECKNSWKGMCLSKILYVKKIKIGDGDVLVCECGSNHNKDGSSSKMDLIDPERRI